MAVDRVAAMREAGGPNLDIIIELHALTDTNTSIQLGQALEKFNCFYYEEPTSPMNPTLFREIAAKVKIPMATGERVLWFPNLHGGNSSAGGRDPKLCHPRAPRQRSTAGEHCHMQVQLCAEEWLLRNSRPSRHRPGTDGRSTREQRHCYRPLRFSKRKSIRARLP